MRGFILRGVQVCLDACAATLRDVMKLEGTIVKRVIRVL